MSVRHRRETFTSSGTWTVPAGVEYAIAHVIGGGGGETGTGGTSSVAFASGTVSSLGGVATGGSDATSRISRVSAVANSGHASQTHGDLASAISRANGAVGGATTPRMLFYGSAVTPAASIDVTVGDGGTGTASGGSGLVIIEYVEEV